MKKKKYGVKLAEFDRLNLRRAGVLPLNSMAWLPPTYRYEVVNLERRGKMVRAYKERSGKDSPELKGDRMNAIKMAKRYEAYWKTHGKFFEDNKERPYNKTSFGG
tara:strand:- start:193 stop:507 length:315 start_codon:yes stop_codon:yes gene_type:complete